MCLPGLLLAICLSGFLLAICPSSRSSLGYLSVDLAFTRLFCLLGFLSSWFSRGCLFVRLPGFHLAVCLAGVLSAVYLSVLRAFFWLSSFVLVKFLVFERHKKYKDRFFSNSELAPVLTSGFGRETIAGTSGFIQWIHEVRTCFVHKIANTNTHTHARTHAHAHTHTHTHTH